MGRPAGHGLQPGNVTGIHCTAGRPAHRRGSPAARRKAGGRRRGAPQPRREPRRLPGCARARQTHLALGALPAAASAAGPSPGAGRVLPHAAQARNAASAPACSSVHTCARARTARRRPGRRAGRARALAGQGAPRARRGGHGASCRCRPTRCTRTVGDRSGRVMTGPVLRARRAGAPHAATHSLATHAGAPRRTR